MQQISYCANEFAKNETSKQLHNKTREPSAVNTTSGHPSILVALNIA